jgi:DNA polymerase-4
MAPRVLHVDLDAFFVEVCRQRHRELRDLELLVVGGRREARGVVQSASYGARRFGVRSGMPIAQAVRLCPQATFFQGSFRHYREASRAVHAVLQRHSPAVLMASLDEAYLDFTGTERLHPVSLLPVAERIRDDVRRDTGLDCSIGIGANRMIAKLASDFAKPRGLMEVRAGWERGFLAGLPLRALPGVGPKTAARWAAQGLVEVAQVQGMPLEDLERVVGPDARGLALRAEGRGNSVVRADGLPKSVSRETTLARDSTDPDYLEGLLALFTARVAAELREAELVTRTVTVKLRRGDFQTITRSATLPVPTDLDTELLPAVKHLFRRAFAEARSARNRVRLVGVAVTNLGRRDPPDLFEPESRHRLRALTQAMDKVRDRFGFTAIRPGRLLQLDPPQ